MKPTLLIVDDDNATLFGFSQYFTNAGYETDTASTLKDADAKIQTMKLEAILIDLTLPDGKGLDWIPKVRKTLPETIIIIITGSGEVATAVEAMQRGADHYMTKPADLGMLDAYIKKSLELGVLRRKDEAQRRSGQNTEPFFGISAVMKGMFELASLAANNDTVVLLTGDTGTGKGVLARWLHNRSQRAAEPFVEVNCASLRGELLSSELFGHVKGSFTSAVNDRQGLIEVANDGTLFLDEISDMDLGVQALLLKAIEERTYRRLGDPKERKSDFRLICASNRELSAEVTKGKFRSDLYYRICVFPIRVPNLRDRIEDIPGLVINLLSAINRNHPGISPEAMDRLRNYSWPGNVRELKNMLERAVILSQGKEISGTHFPGLTQTDPVVQAAVNDGKLEQMERQLIKSTLSEHNGDTKKASKILGISRASLYRKLVKIKESV